MIVPLGLNGGVRIHLQVCTNFDYTVFCHREDLAFYVIVKEAGTSGVDRGNHGLETEGQREVSGRAAGTTHPQMEGAWGSAGQPSDCTGGTELGWGPARGTAEGRLGVALHVQAPRGSGAGATPPRRHLC